jgi:hypothetical protein
MHDFGHTMMRRLEPTPFLFKERSGTWSLGISADAVAWQVNAAWPLHILWLLLLPMLSSGLSCRDGKPAIVVLIVSICALPLGLFVIFLRMADD